MVTGVSRLLPVILSPRRRRSGQNEAGIRIMANRPPSVILVQ
jgi:hypothetical protein